MKLKQEETELIDELIKIKRICDNKIKRVHQIGVVNPCYKNCIRNIVKNFKIINIFIVIITI